MDALSFLKGSHKRGEMHLATVSGVATTKKELIELFDRKIPSIDIITTKSFQVKPNPGNREPVVCSPSPGNFGNSVGLRNPGMDVIIPELREIREHGMRALLNVSLSASSPEDFITLVKASDPYADMLELNFSCPHAAAGYGASIGSDKDIASSYVKAINEAYPELWAFNLARAGLQAPKLNEEAHVLSMLAERLDLRNAIANRYVKRMWTSPQFNNVRPGDEHLAVWHLPYEKKRGLYRLFRLLEKQKGLGDEARFWEKAKAWTGVPAVSLVKRLRDRWTTLRMRFD